MRVSTGDQLAEDIEDLLRYLDLHADSVPARRLSRGLWRAVEDGDLRAIQVQRLMYAVLNTKGE